MLAATTCSSVGSPAARAREPAGTRQDRLDARVAGTAPAAQRRPSRRRREIGARRGLMPQPPGDPRQPFLLPGQHAVDVGVLEADARRRPAPRRDTARTAPRIEPSSRARQSRSRVRLSSAVRPSLGHPVISHVRPASRTTRDLPARTGLPAAGGAMFAEARRSCPGSAAPRRRSRPAQRSRAECTALPRRRSR